MLSGIPPASYDAGRPSSSYDAGPSGERSPGRLRRFVREYGWRAYALPLLIVITIVALAEDERAGRAAPSRFRRRGLRCLAQPVPGRRGQDRPIPR